MTEMPETTDSTTTEATQDRESLAAELLAQQTPRPTIRERLMALGLSRRTAYRVLDAAAEKLGLRPSAPDEAAEDADGTPAADTAPVEETTPPDNACTPELKVQVTYLRAPWPEGTDVGSIVRLPGAEVPSWAIGKCRIVDAGTPVDFTWQPPLLVPDTDADAADTPGTAASGPTVAYLHDKLQTLLAQRTALDLEGVRKHASATKAAHDATRAKFDTLLAEQTDTSRWQANALGNGQLREQSSNMRQANTLLDQATRQHAEQTREIQRLRSMLEGAQRVALAEKALAGAADVQAAARSTVEKAQQAVAVIDSMIAAEEKAISGTRATVAAQLLQAVKSGSSATAVAAASRDKITTLELAKAGAQEELEAARKALKAAQAEHGAKASAVLIAKAGVTELRHELALAEYVDALADHLQTYAAAHKAPFHALDPRVGAWDRFRERVDPGSNKPPML
jgi:hypothetical protein